MTSPQNPKQTRQRLFLAATPVALFFLTGLGMRVAPLFSSSSSSEDDAPVSLRAYDGGLHHAAQVRAPVMKTADKKTQALLEKAVGGQLAALGKKDFKAALQFSQPGMRQSWTPERFAEMLIAGYAPMLAVKKTVFQPAQVSQHTALLRAALTGEDGKTITYMYVLERDADAWHISTAMPMNPGEMGHSKEPLDPRLI